MSNNENNTNNRRRWFRRNRRPRTNNRRRWPWIVLILALIIGIVFGAIKAIDHFRGNDDSNDNNDRNALIADWLRIDTIDPRADCLALVEASGRQIFQLEGTDIRTYQWAIRELGSLAPLQAGNLAARQTSTSVGIPLARNAEGVVDAVNGRDQVLTRICLDPQFGSMVGNGFANLPGVAENNVDDNWDLRRWAGEPKEVINARATEYMDLFGASALSDQEVIDRAVEYQQVIAPRLITLVLKLDVMGVEARTSVLNYHLVDGGLTAGLPVIGYNPLQEGLDAVVLGLTQKDRPECPLLLIGFNIYDGRWEQFALPEDCEPVGLVPPGTSNPPTDTVPPTQPTTPPTDTVPPTQPTTTVKPPYTTVAPSQETIAPPITAAPVTPPPTAAPDTVPAGATVNPIDEVLTPITVGNVGNGVPQPTPSTPAGQPTNGNDGIAPSGDPAPPSR